MQAKKLTLKNFRNFGDLELSFNPGLTVISGPNGAGKTNILEALYMCSIGRSARTRQDGLLISKGKSASQVVLDYERASTIRSVGVHLSETKGKTVLLDGMPSGKISEIVGNFACVYFSPNEIDIVRGGPQYRRRFMDIINCQVSRNYMNDLKNLQHCLKQRNALLRGIKMANIYDHSLDPWDSQIVKYSMRIMLRRYNFLKSLQKLVDYIMRILTGDRETLRITYRTFCDRLDQIQVQSFAQEYYRKVRQNYVKDVLTHTSSIGPHLDDFEIRLVYLRSEDKKLGRDAEEFEYINLRNEGSLGQQRTATLALKIAEIFIYHRFYGEKPVLLLDDVLSELDYVRRRKLMDYCKHFDTIITCTEWSYENPAPDTWYRVDEGVVTQCKVEPERFTYQGEFNARALEFAKRINEMREGYFERDVWLEPVRNRVAGHDFPKNEAPKPVEFPQDKVEKVYNDEGEEIRREDICFNPWDDEGQPLKRSHRSKK